MIRRLRRKITWISTAVAMVMLLVVFGFIHYYTVQGLTYENIMTLQQTLDQTPGPWKPGHGRTGCFLLEKTRDGRLIARGDPVYELTDVGQLEEIFEAAQQRQEKTGLLGHYRLRYLRDSGPEGVRYAFMDVSAEGHAVYRLITAFVIIGFCAFWAFLALSALLARWAVKPVEQAWQRQKQFVADASHELKTPLTVILTNAELLQSEEYPPEQKKKFGESILTMSRQMRGLVEGLLELARADRDRVPVEMSRLDMGKLAEEAALPFEPVYFEQGLELQTGIGEGLYVRGNRQQLRQVMDILLDNGVKYSAPHSTCVLSVKRQGRRILMQFFSPGVPLTQQQCRDIFKRLYRADPARAMSGSYGLGLAIAHRIVTEHGGKIWARGTETGNAFFVSLTEERQESDRRRRTEDPENCQKR